MILRFEAQLSYQESSDVLILSQNLTSIENDLDVIEKQLNSDLKMKRVIKIQANSFLISSSLDLVLKSNDKWRRIHHLSHSNTYSVNDNIFSKIVELNYTKFQNIL
jgi:hypothetical protein